MLIQVINLLKIKINYIINNIQDYLLYNFHNLGIYSKTGTRFKMKYKKINLNGIKYFCCYVGIPNNFKFCEDTFELNNLMFELNIPGGVTYTSNDFFIQGLDSNLFWIGFDTAHIDTLTLAKKDIKLELTNMLLSIVNFILKYE